GRPEIGHEPWSAPLREHLIWIQRRLFNLASMIATQNLPSSTMPTLTMEDVGYLEGHIDALDATLPTLKNFILPGGSPPIGYLHLARTVCRRAERACYSLSRQESFSPVILPFLNRLSDDLFVSARWVAKERGEEDTLWLGRKEDGTA